MKFRNILIKLTIAVLLLTTLCSCGSKEAIEVTVTEDCDYNFFQYRQDTCSNEAVVYFVLPYEQMLMFYDKQSGVCAPLCGKPECDHTDYACNAYFPSSDGLCLYNGKLYRFYESGKTIVCSDTDGTNKTTVRSVNTTLFTDNFTGSYISDPSSAFHRGWFYYAAGVTVVSAGLTTDYARVIAYPIDSDEEGTLIYSSDEYKNVAIEPYGDYIYIMAYDDSSHDVSRMEIVRYSVETGESETLYKGEKSFQSRRFRVTDDAIIFCGCTLEDYTIYKLTFGEDTIETIYEGTYYYTYGFIGENILLGLYKADGADGFDVSIIDQEGNTLMETTVEYEDLEAGRFVIPQIMGTDEDYIYIDTRVWYNDYPYESIIALSLDGSEQTTLWSNAEEVNAGEYVWN
ncbi:MAG: hypothetical protein LUH23_00880 [Oscillospiraceae bacterium]|nr:hypothetical protein [Oscillospiraceae bacterium]